MLKTNLDGIRKTDFFSPVLQGCALRPPETWKTYEKVPKRPAAADPEYLAKRLGWLNNIVLFSSYIIWFFFVDVYNVNCINYHVHQQLEVTTSTLR